jgi:hypothetical protein
MQHKIDYASTNTYELDDHLILLEQGANRIQVLNPLAKHIWYCKKNGVSSETIATEIAKSFNIQPSLALQDVRQVISQWSLELSKSDSPLYKIPKSIEADLPESWQPIIEAAFIFPRFSLRLRYDSQDIANQVETILGYVKANSAGKADHTIDVITHENRYLIATDGVIGELADSPEYAALMTFREIDKLHGSREDWLLLLHAAGVSWGGDGIIIPAASGSGKTTLSAALIQRGFHFINDDIIPVERSTGRLISLPISLSIKSGSWEPLLPFYPKLMELPTYNRYGVEAKFLPPPDEKNHQAGYSARYLIIPRYEAGSDHHLESVSSVEGLQAIINGHSQLSRQPNQPLVPNKIEELTAWISKLRCYSLSYSDLDNAVEMITELVASNPG